MQKTIYFLLVRNLSVITKFKNIDNLVGMTSLVVMDTKTQTDLVQILKELKKLEARLTVTMAGLADELTHSNADIRQFRNEYGKLNPAEFSQQLAKVESSVLEVNKSIAAIGAIGHNEASNVAIEKIAAQLSQITEYVLFVCNFVQNRKKEVDQIGTQRHNDSLNFLEKLNAQNLDSFGGLIDAKIGNSLGSLADIIAHISVLDEKLGQLIENSEATKYLSKLQSETFAEISNFQAKIIEDNTQTAKKLSAKLNETYNEGQKQTDARLDGIREQNSQNIKRIDQLGIDIGNVNAINLEKFAALDGLIASQFKELGDSILSISKDLQQRMQMHNETNFAKIEEKTTFQIEGLANGFEQRIKELEAKVADGQNFIMDVLAKSKKEKGFLVGLGLTKTSNVDELVDMQFSASAKMPLIASFIKRTRKLLGFKQIAILAQDAQTYLNLRQGGACESAKCAIIQTGIETREIDSSMLAFTEMNQRKYDAAFLVLVQSSNLNDKDVVFALGTLFKNSKNIIVLRQGEPALGLVSLLEKNGANRNYSIEISSGLHSDFFLNP